MPSESSGRPEIDRRPFHVAGWRVDPSACRLARDGDEVHIEPKVMLVLVHLAERPGQVVGRQELEELVWTDTVVGYEAVTNAVIKLRKALGDDARHPEIIETIPKRGYRLLAEVTPLSPEPPSPTESGSAVPRRHAPAITLVALVVVVTGVLAWWRPWSPEIEPASLERMAHPLPDKPSIAVLPFENLSGDSEKEFMVDGMTEQIISSLARIPEIFVIARSSTLVYKDEPVEVRQVAEELGVQYVMEGSLQSSDDRVRVTAQLIDALSGLHVWSEQYDRDLDDFFALLDDITLQIGIAMAAELSWGERAYIESRSATDLKAWLLVQQGDEEVDSYTPDGLRKARELFLKALERDPNYATAWIWVAWTHFFDAYLGYSDSRSDSLRLVGEYMDKAASIDPESAHLYNLRGRMHLIKDEIDKAVEFGQKTIDTAPGNSLWIAGFAQILYFSGEFDRCIEHMLKAKRLSPRHPAWYDLYLGRAYAMNREYDSAEHVLGRLTAEEISPTVAAGAHITLAFVFIETGRDDEARAEIDKARARFGWASVAFYEGFAHYKDPAHWERFAAALRKAGLPETSG